MMGCWILTIIPLPHITGRLFNLNNGLPVVCAPTVSENRYMKRITISRGILRLCVIASLIAGPRDRTLARLVTVDYSDSYSW